MVTIKNQNISKRLFSTSCRQGYLLTEAVMALTLLGMLLGFVALFEYRAAAAARSLELEYVATVAAETQVERLKAGLNVQDQETFRRSYPGLALEYLAQPEKSLAVVTVKALNPQTAVSFKLTCPLSPARRESGEK